MCWRNSSTTIFGLGLAFRSAGHPDMDFTNKGVLVALLHDEAAWCMMYCTCEICVGCKTVLEQLNHVIHGRHLAGVYGGRVGVNSCTTLFLSPLLSGWSPRSGAGRAAHEAVLTVLACLSDLVSRTSMNSSCRPDLVAATLRLGDHVNDVKVVVCELAAKGLSCSLIIRSRLRCFRILRSRIRQVMSADYLVLGSRSASSFGFTVMMRLWLSFRTSV